MKNSFKFSISICPEPLPKSMPFVFTGDIPRSFDRVKAAGYDAVEIVLRDPDRTLDVNQVIKGCERTGLGVSAIMTALDYVLDKLSMIDDNEDVRNECHRRMIRNIEIAHEVGCDTIIVGCVKGNLPYDDTRDLYYKRFKDELLRLSDETAKYGICLGVEGINFYVNNYLNTLKDITDLIHELGRDNIKVHMDTHHMAIEESNMLEAVKYAGKNIGYVHFTENNRMYPGSGKTDFLSILKELRKIDYKGYIGLEIAPKPDEDTCAVKSMEYLNKLVELVDFPTIF